MGSTMQRYISELGQVILPIEHRKALAWIEKDVIDVTLDKRNQRIILKKAIPACFVCQSKSNLTQIKGKHVCEECKQELAAVPAGAVIE